MEEQPIPVITEKRDALDVYQQLRRISVFSHLKEEDAGCIGQMDLVHAPKGATLFEQGATVPGFWAVIEGRIRGFKREKDGSNTFLLEFAGGDSFGEVPLLSGKPSTVSACEVVEPSTLINIGEEGFWKLMATCPAVRKAILSNMERRLQSYQAFTLHREKLISLGTLAAGLMHELNNPGAAARRAASQLRENLVRLQQISLRLSTAPMRADQIDCMRELQQRALTCEKQKAMSTLDQSDAEEALAEWLDQSGVQNSWKLAPTLTAIGITAQQLGCALHAFPGETFSDALNWLESLVSSMQLVGAVEESITRVSELVIAVKKYSYNENPSSTHEVDIHDGLQSTLTILGHKFRPKALKIDKNFAADVPAIHTCGTGLNQVWTNLIDNAIDASPPEGTIHIRTWVEAGQVCIGIADEGSGIAEQNATHIFEPFFTTKPVGVGTGLGLDIAHRIVAGYYGGQIGFTSGQGKTEFIVRLPIEQATRCQVTGQSR